MVTRGDNQKSRIKQGTDNCSLMPSQQPRWLYQGKAKQGEPEQTKSKETTKTKASFTQTKSSLYIKNNNLSSDFDQSCKDGLQHDQHEN